MKKLGLLALLMIGVQCYGAEVPITEREAEVLGNRFYLGKREANNYPFSLPEDRVTVNTVYVSNQRGQEVSAETLPIIQEKVSHIVVEDEVDIRPFVALARGGLEKGYGIHFYGLNRLEGLGDILRAWSGDESTAYLHHLDVAIQGMKEGDLRREVVGRIGEALSLPASEKLETLSLRFMHLDPENMGYLYGILRDRPRPFLKRLILSYNDLTDDLLGTGGALEQIIGERTQLSSLSIMDLRGNSFESVAAWNIGAGLFRRRVGGIYTLKLLLNGFEDYKTAGFLTGAVVTRRGIDKEAINAMKRDEEIGIENRWFLEGEYASPEDVYPYRDLGDQLSLMAHKGGWRSLDLRERRLESRDIRDLLRTVSSLTKINLEGAYRGGRSFNMEDHRSIVESLGGMPLISLNLGKNQLGYIARVYEGLSALSTLKQLSFGSNEMGSSPIDLENTEVDQFLIGLRFGFLSLKILELQENILTDRDFDNILGIMEEKGGGIYNLSGNRIALRRMELLLKTLSAFARDPLRKEEPFYIDLRDNQIDEGIIKSFTSLYERGVTESPELNWPVVHISLPLGGGGYKKGSFMGNVRSFVNLIRAKVIREGEWSFLEELEREESHRIRSRLFNRIAVEGMRSIPLLRRLGDLQELSLIGELAPAKSTLIGALGELTGLTSLNLEANEIGAEDISSLSTSLIRMPGLTDLSLARNKIGEGMGILSEVLGELRSLSKLGLWSNNLTIEVMPYLARALRNLPNLTWLHVGGNPIKNEGVRIIGEALAMGPLEWLSLGACQLTSEGAGILRDVIRGITSLKELALEDNNLGDAGATALGEALRGRTSFSALYVYRNNFGREGTQALGSALGTIRNFKKLAFYGQNSQEAGMEAIVRAFEMLTQLKWISAAGFSSDQFIRLCGSLVRNPNLLTISLETSDSTREIEKATALANVLRNTPRLEYLGINNNWTRDGYSVLAPSLPLSLETIYVERGYDNTGVGHLMSSLERLTRLEKLILQQVRLGVENARIIFPKLSSLIHLEALNISYNSFGAEGASVLAGGLRGTKHLKFLNISNTNIEDEGLLALLPSLIEIKTLVNLWLESNGITTSSASPLSLMLKKLPFLTKLGLKGNPVASDAGAMDGLRENLYDARYLLI